ncbi:Uncharacterized protein TCAP_02900 [Tolypocladium capitatum]|uniref:Uncharacterized protein n=1 Tax=Tolypocladium capitatum TaxID=45235 RepID=A0A2K3QI27_9HYPO|nr:Uncharacterized protein TCAP_02900 [Tolypocladium capitatum]
MPSSSQLAAGPVHKKRASTRHSARHSVASHDLLRLTLQHQHRRRPVDNPTDSSASSTQLHPRAPDAPQLAPTGLAPTSLDPPPPPPAMRRPSTSSGSDTSSTCSGATDATACSYTKDPVAEPPAAPRRGLRQRARDVVHDLGAPPTRRQDAKDGKRTLDFAEVALIGDSLSKPTKI